MFSSSKAETGTQLPVMSQQGWSGANRRTGSISKQLCGVLALLGLGLLIGNAPDGSTEIFKAGLNQCRQHHELPSPGSHLDGRTVSDRYEESTRPVYIYNATIWTGADNGTEILYNSSILLQNGLVKKINPAQHPLDAEVEMFNAKGSWVTPGIVDMHSHAGQVTFPIFAGTNSLVSRNNIIMPFSQAIDSFNTHDLALRLVTAGGTTTSMILPGSSSAMGGEAWPMKFRNTTANSPTSMLVDPPFAVNERGSYGRTKGWRNAKHALGENVSKTWKDKGGTREDTIYYIRAAYASAAKKRFRQDEWCRTASTYAKRQSRILRWPFGSRPSSHDIRDLGAYPDSTLEEELLVDVLRGKVRIHVHAYESTDFDALMRITNEFGFPIASIQHAHEAWFSTETLKKFHGGAPAIAMFATSSIYKHEAYRHSLFAPIILAEQGIPVIFKSDHPPAVDSRYLLAEACLGHYYGLEANLALMSVTSAPAKAIGLDHRIGYLLPGYDADVVIWQSHPLAIGATPAQVYVDGIPQLDDPALVVRGPQDQHVPPSANYSQQLEVARKSHHGDVDLTPISLEQDITFTNVSSYISRVDGLLKEETYTEGEVVVQDGVIVCAGVCRGYGGEKRMNLMGGSISPGLTLYGTSLGLIEINEEPSTTDHDQSPLSLVPPSGAVTRAADGAVFNGKETFISLRAGITNAITPPLSSNIFKGYSMYITPSSPHRLHPAAMIEKEVAYHVSIGHAPVYPVSPTGLQISAQIQALFTLLTKEEAEGLTPLEKTFQKIARGEIVLVVFVSSADQMATLIDMKKDVEAINDSKMKMVFDNALEAHLIADEIAAADVAVITRVRGNPVTWDDYRALPGAPLSEDTNISTLRKAGVTVAIGMTGSRASTSNLRFYLAYSMTDDVGKLGKVDALALATTNLEKILGVPSADTWVATEYGGLLEIGQSKAVAVGRGDGAVAIL
ncbi:hypothetical protein I302_103135 [Kwoniella bestiolae CBS 10118]|uniref:Amidohydrolase-related domain-containing protein n=1 Tax=Kwoniella bestiolae CBS 10118 TaxID=1296100 RepID=A0A1B9G7J1_9TREE|nr:hypothetical protein I302_01834 [Kwoniella bestiolae CBS 10118]OCF26999.1 hypothetical protein I302_01834 [Kwoniella bestiolae CBS 10118]